MKSKLLKRNYYGPWTTKLEASQMTVNAESRFKKICMSVICKVPHCIVSLVLSCETIDIFISYIRFTLHGLEKTKTRFLVVTNGWQYSEGWWT